MKRIIFLLEEPSMKQLLEGLIPRLLPEAEFLCVPHEGTGDLLRSIPVKLRAWREPGVRFVVVHDNDGGDCLGLKQELVELCRANGRPDTVVRIPCQELEAWYFGDLSAVARVFATPAIAQLEGKRRYRNPDAIQKPSQELQRLVPEFQKVSGARQMGRELALDANRSRSFQVMLEGIRRSWSQP